MMLAYCHMCTVAHDEWTQGDIWQCRRCLFRIPAAHVWFPNVQEQEETGEDTQEYAQMELSL